MHVTAPVEAVYLIAAVTVKLKDGGFIGKITAQD